MLQCRFDKISKRFRIELFYFVTAQADQEVVKATGRSDPNNSPTELSKTIEKLLSDLTGLFKNGFTRFFRDSDDDENEVSQDENRTDIPDEGKDNESRDVGG